MQYTLDIAICPDSHYIWSKSCRGCGSLLCTLPECPEYRSHCPAQCQALKACEAQEKEELLNQSTRCLLCGTRVTNRERHQHLALCDQTLPATRR